MTFNLYITIMLKEECRHNTVYRKNKNRTLFLSTT